MLWHHRLVHGKAHGLTKGPVLKPGGVAQLLHLRAMVVMLGLSILNSTHVIVCEIAGPGRRRRLHQSGGCSAGC